MWFTGQRGRLGVVTASLGQSGDLIWAVAAGGRESPVRLVPWSGRLRWRALAGPGRRMQRKEPRDSVTGCAGLSDGVGQKQPFL